MPVRAFPHQLVKGYLFDRESGLLVALRKAMPIHARGPDVTTISTYERTNIVMMPRDLERP